MTSMFPTGPTDTMSVLKDTINLVTPENSMASKQGKQKAGCFV